jgi:Fe-S cluster assembly ATP-binding protein
MHPKLAILDEPDSGIDVLSLEDIARLIRRMASEGITVLLITHRDEMVPVADVASLICGGEIIRTGDPKVVREHYARRCIPCELAEPVESEEDYERYV